MLFGGERVGLPSITKSRQRKSIAETCGDHDVRASQDLGLLRIIVVLVGIALVGLSVLFPNMMVTATEHRGFTATFEVRFLSLLTPFITLASMASSFLGATVILSFENSRPSRESILFGISTLSVFVMEIILSIYVSLVPRQSAAAPVLAATRVLVGLVPLGLACTAFTLGSLMPLVPLEEKD